MKTKLLLSATAALFLSACIVYDGPDRDDRSYDRNDRAPRVERDRSYDDDRRDRNLEERRSSRAEATRYSCRNGLAVQVYRINDDRIELRLDDKRTVMTNVRSGSGALYVSDRGLFGTGAQWHSKGGTAVFEFKDPYGNNVKTTCQAA